MSLMHQYLQKLLRRVAKLVCAYPRQVLIVGIILAVLSAGITVARFKVINNTSDLLSDNSPPKQHYNQLLKEFGSDYRFLILIKSPDPVKNRALAEQLGPWLENLKPQIGTVLYKINFSTITPRILFTRDVKDLETIAAQVEDEVKAQGADSQKNALALNLNSVLDEANDKFNDKYLRQQANASWKDFKHFVSQFDDILNKVSDEAEDKTNNARHSQGEGGNFTDFDASDLIAQHEYFSLQNGQALLLIAYPNTTQANSDDLGGTVDTIRQHLAEMEAANPGTEVRVTGEPVLDTDQINASNSDATKAGFITLGLILVLFGFSYRFYVRPAFAFITLIMAVFWSFGFTFLTIGHFNILSIAVIPMVLGIGIDFGIQILGRYEEELGHGQSADEAVQTALEHTGVAIITGGSTTAVAFFTLCFNDFVGLAELGLIAGASMIFCLLANLFVLPAFFLLRDRSRPPAELQAMAQHPTWSFLRTWDHDLVRSPRIWLIISALISLAAILSLPYLGFDYNLLHLQNQSTPSVQTLYEVMDASKNDQGEELSTIYASIVTDNIQDARVLGQKLAALPVVAKVDSIYELVPLDQDKKIPVIQRIVTAAKSLNIKPTPVQPVDVPKAKADITSLLAQALDAQKQANSFKAFQKARDAAEIFGEMIPALQRINHAFNSVPRETLEKRLNASNGGIFGRLQKNIDLLKAQLSDRGLQMQDIPPELQKLYLSPSGKVLLQVYGKKDLWERDADEEFTKAILAAAPQATGTPILNYYGTDLILTSYLQAAGWAFLAITLLILLHFQSFKYLLLTLTPLILAVLWRTGAMVWFGLDFNPANIVTLPLIIGIDVAFGVYIVDRFREDGRLKIFSGSTGKAIFMSSLTSLFGFSSLLISKFVGMFSIGLLMSLGLAIGLVTSIFILPQILALIQPPEEPRK